jgi:hypothetical protein
MKPVTITQNGKVIAEHTTDSPLSHYGQSVWVVQEPEPSPGAATWLSGAVEMQIDIICVRDGWLVCKQHDGLLCGIIWSDGDYYANLLVDKNDVPARKWKNSGLHVLGAVLAFGGLGSILPLDPGIPPVVCTGRALEEPEAPADLSTRQADISGQ